jgi:predicted restriction endonuclease
MYGANKYETTLLGVALSFLSTMVEIYQVSEGDLTELPETSQKALNSLKNVKLIASDFSMERNEFLKQDNLRSPLYIYNLLDRLGPKKCALCDCEIPELIQGAHIWPISEIKKVSDASIENKVRWATDGENGLWLCENHHKMFDANLITITETGKVEYVTTLEESHKKFIIETTPHLTLEPNILSPKFLNYLQKRLSVPT